ncbi:hypothetical protein DPMN_084329 [Dreissena polymorpha]|uniref:Uncharacterized protein n=1 Tax=Dreissena polymorpha TaxID=45954 RepID=A0A9D4BJA1_DREPO|nr:hypothetical protein DPMN_084329 [Dreissena polymorpha]
MVAREIAGPDQHQVFELRGRTGEGLNADLVLREKRTTGAFWIVAFHLRISVG